MWCSSRIHLRTLLFLLYVNDLHHASKVLNPIMFADDTNLFFSHSDINILFEKINKELTNVSNWFNANKLSLNVQKTKFSFFHKSSKKLTPSICSKWKMLRYHMYHVSFMYRICSKKRLWRLLNFQALRCGAY